MINRIWLIIALAIWQAALILLAVILIPMVARWWGDYLGWSSAVLTSIGLAVFSAMFITWWVCLTQKEKK